MMPPRSNSPPRSLTELAYRAIKQEIPANRLRSGEPLPKERLIKKLGLSRTPIREAILRLDKEGFIEIKPRMGTFVSHLDLREIQEMYEVRRALEGLAARLVAERIDPESLAKLERRLLGLTALSEAGQQLHRLIVDSCENKVLARFIQSLREHFRRFRALSLAIREKVLSSHREHLAIVEALKRGDGEEAQRLVHEHFDHAARYLLESLMSRTPVTVPVRTARS